jgi:hypothetical protein
MLWVGGLSSAALAATLLLPTAGAVVVGLLTLALMMAAGFAPLGSLAADKMHGHLEFDRTLPIPLRTIAAARLLGAALRTAPLSIGLVAAGIAIAREAEAPAAVAAPLILLVAATLHLLWICFLWTMLGLNARYSMRRLWWLPMTLWLLPSLLPETAEAAIGGAFERAAEHAMRWMDAPWRVALVAAAALVLPVVAAFTGGVALFARGLARFRPDPAAFGVQLGAAPKRELAALGRGPLLAVARLRLRLAFEQFRREVIIAAVLVVVVVADIGQLAIFARGYLPILAALVPGGIALQLLTARGTGALEGLQHLPHPRRLVALGHLLAVMVLALPGAALLGLSRATNGIAVTPTTLAMTWLWYLAMGSIGAALAVWGTRRRLLGVVLGFGLLLGGVWLIASRSASASDIPDLIEHLGRLRTGAGPVMPLAAAAIALLLGTELFARGLASYDGRPKQK